MNLNVISCCFLALTVCIAFSSARRRVYNGNKAEIENFPWIVSIQYGGGRFGAGSILSEYFVLTAAHLIDPSLNSTYKVIYGTAKPFEDDYSGGTANVVKNFYPHPNYDTSDRFMVHDIAIMEVENLIEFSESIKPVTLQKARAEATQKVQVVGWGKNEQGGYSRHLRYATAYVVGLPECKKRADYHPAINDDKVCTTTNSCFGDSGGPLMAGQKQIGIVSEGVLAGGCTDKYFPALYTSVANNKDFINSHSKNTAKWSW